LLMKSESLTTSRYSMREGNPASSCDYAETRGTLFGEKGGTRRTEDRGQKTEDRRPRRAPDESGLCSTEDVKKAGRVLFIRPASLL